MPSCSGRRRAASSTLSAGLAKQVDRLMASPRLDAGMRAFFDDMLQLDTFDTVSKDSLLYPKWGSAMADLGARGDAAHRDRPDAA